MSITTALTENRVEVQERAKDSEAVSTSATLPRVLVAEQHTLVRHGLCNLLAGHVQLVGDVADGRALLAAVTRLQPDLVMLAIALPGLNGLDVVRQLARLCPHTRAIFVTMHDEPAFVREAFRAGAAGYVIKRSPFAELLLAVQEVLAGRRYLCKAITPELSTLLSEAAPANGTLADKLTTRQREVLQLVAEGRTAQQAAEVLHISRKTVEYHKASLMRSLGAHSCAELTRYAFAHGMIGP
jgi:DNA-binding NarL/FixJ family response regulator